MLILAPACSPYQQTLSVFSSSFFLFSSQDVLAQDLAGELRKKKKKKKKGGKERSGEEGRGVEERKEEKRKKTAPGLEEDIVRMCTEARGLWPAA